jgi:hypothetical protein
LDRGYLKKMLRKKLFSTKTLSNFGDLTVYLDGGGSRKSKNIQKNSESKIHKLALPLGVFKKKFYI